MIYYEWDYENIDPETGDIIDHNHAEKLAYFGNSHKDDRLVLVCDIGNEIDGITDRFWAYVIDGKLPTHFSDCLDKPMHKVPARFHAELYNYLNKQQ